MLTFVLKEKWYNKIVSGEKTHEYRLKKSFWDVRVANQKKIYRDNPIPCRFTKGYTSTFIEGIITDISIKNKSNTDLKDDTSDIALVYDFAFKLK